MTRDRIFAAAAKWWSDTLRATSAPTTGSDYCDAVVESVRGSVTEDDLLAFETALVEKLRQAVPGEARRIPRSHRYEYGAGQYPIVRGNEAALGLPLPRRRAMMEVRLETDWTPILLLGEAAAEVDLRFRASWPTKVSMLITDGSITVGGYGIDSRVRWPRVVVWEHASHLWPNRRARALGWIHCWCGKAVPRV